MLVPKAGFDLEPVGYPLDSSTHHSEPRLPSVRLTRIEVSNSKFLGPIVLDFNPQYNAVIGGRGTGKSTILEYIRWALCDQPPTLAPADHL
jgi:chromosome segregation protein